jgi:hypothetical protein
MPQRSCIDRAVRVGLTMAAMALVVHPARAQTAGNGFMFGTPHGSLTLRAGLAQPSAGGDVFQFARHELTLNRNSFVGATGGANFDVHLAGRLSLQLNGSFSGRSVPSEQRNWVDNNDKPIQQTSTLMRVPISAGLRFDLIQPGRTLGRLAWVPSRVVPYVAGGGGLMWYRFAQKGDFVDSKTLNVFNDELVTSSWTSGAYGAAGVDVTVRPGMSITTEARYDRAHAKTSADFSGFDRIDLSGLAFTVGLSFRY